MIQFEILVQKATKRFVHHIVAYECDDGFDGTPYIGGRECGSVSMPNEIMAKCMGAIFVGWGVGAQYVNSILFQINKTILMLFILIIHSHRITVFLKRLAIHFIQT